VTRDRFHRNKKSRARRWFGVSLCGALAGAAEAQTAQDLSRLSMEELVNIEITSVSKRAEPLRNAAAAIYVISGDDIRRAGATSIPDALRLAPNLQVARIDASQYAISARGFNTTTSNKLLVLIDGRSVYTPLYSGVFWDVQDVVLGDIERIEVISGPGGTLWGSNAVNGVINIITRRWYRRAGRVGALRRPLRQRRRLSRLWQGRGAGRYRNGQACQR
jgi:iron complex outermembrane recepter protein